MRLAIVIGREHGKKEFTAISPPTDPDTARAVFHKLLEEPHNFEEVQVWTKHVTKRKTFPISHAKGAKTLSVSAFFQNAPELATPVAAQNMPESVEIPSSEHSDEPTGTGDDDGPSLLSPKKKK